MPFQRSTPLEMASPLLDNLIEEDARIGELRGFLRRESVFEAKVIHWLFLRIFSARTAITGPTGEHEGGFVNRKSFHSIDVQMKNLELIFAGGLVAHSLMACHYTYSAAQ